MPNPFRKLRKLASKAFGRGGRNAAAPENPTDAQGQRSATSSPQLFGEASRAGSPSGPAIQSGSGAVNPAATDRSPSASPVMFTGSRSGSPLVFGSRPPSVGGGLGEMTFSTPPGGGPSSGSAFGREAGVPKQNITRRGKNIEEMSLSSIENNPSNRERTLQRHKSEEALHPKHSRLASETGSTLRRHAAESSEVFEKMKLDAQARVSAIKSQPAPPLTENQQKAADRDRQRQREREAREARRPILGSSRTASRSMPDVSSYRPAQGSAIPPVPSVPRAPGASTTGQASPASSRSSSPSKSAQPMSDKAKGKQRDKGPSPE